MVVTIRRGREMDIYLTYTVCPVLMPVSPKQVIEFSNC